eukprot:754267-Hanusia_phi.AAC.6
MDRRMGKKRVDERNGMRERSGIQEGEKVMAGGGARDAGRQRRIHGYKRENNTSTVKQKAKKALRPLAWSSMNDTDTTLLMERRIWGRFKLLVRSIKTGRGWKIEQAIQCFAQSSARIYLGGKECQNVPGSQVPAGTPIL